MLFKKEFKADKPKSGFLSKLYLTPLQRKGLLKWVLYSLLLILLSVLQDVVLSRLRLFGATTDLVPCGIILICILEGAESGSIFALIASALYLFSGTAPGPYSLVFLTALAIGTSIFRQAYLQKGLGAALLYLTGFEQWQCSTSSVPAMGFNGIAAAFLGGLHPMGSIFSSFFIQHITAGGAYVDKTLYCAQVSDFISSLIIYLCGFVLFMKTAMNRGLDKADEKRKAKNNEGGKK